MPFSCARVSHDILRGQLVANNPGTARTLYSGTVKKSFGTFSRLFPDSPDFFETFFQTLGGSRGLRETFFRLFRGFGARRARETPVNGQRVPNGRGSWGCFLSGVWALPPVKLLKKGIHKEMTKQRMGDE